MGREDGKTEVRGGKSEEQKSEGQKSEIGSQKVKVKNKRD